MQKMEIKMRFSLVAEDDLLGPFNIRANAILPGAVSGPRIGKGTPGGRPRKAHDPLAGNDLRLAILHGNGRQITDRTRAAEPVQAPCPLGKVPGAKAGSCKLQWTNIPHC
jgi:NAD(P)-dependent dehydrogenase (short-subunit alcohol dehydrogenase family)